MFHLFVDSYVERLLRIEAVVNIMQAAAGCFTIRTKDCKKRVNCLTFFTISSDDDVMKLNYCSVSIIKKLVAFILSNIETVNFIST